MWPTIRKFFLDETAFTGAVRAILLGLGGAVTSGMPIMENTPKWMGVAALMAGGFIRAGEKNPKAGD